MTIKYIATTKEWIDKVNGNSYFSTRIEDIKKDVMYILPFQYGYGTQSEYIASQLLRKIDPIVVWGNIKHIKIDRCLKREVTQHGTGTSDSYLPNLECYYQD